jgi:hypothetical protein
MGKELGVTGESAVDTATADSTLADLHRAYRQGNVVLFVGAGLSVAADLPSRGRVVELLTERAKAQGAAAETLAEIAAFAEKHQLLDAISAAKECLGAVEFGAVIDRHCDDQDIERLPPLALSIGALRPGLRAALTTNLDGLLERAFGGAWPAVARATADIAQRRRFILKLHGTLVDRSTWVLTRDDHDRAMHADEKLKEAFATLFPSMAR